MSPATVTPAVLPAASDAANASTGPEILPKQPAKRSWRRAVSVRTLVVAGVLVVAVLATVFGRGWVHRYYAPRNWAVVEPGRIYRSGQISKELMRETLQANGIKTVVFMSEDKADRPDVDAERAISDELGIQRYNFPLAGNGVGNPVRYIDAIEVMARCDRAGQPVLVHCHTGSQRTGGAVALYRVLVQGRPGSEAYAELLAHGHDPKENPSLIPFLNQRMAEIARSLADRGVIPAAPAVTPVISP